MRFFIRNGDHGVSVDIDDLPESAMFFDEETKQEARSTLAAAFAILLGVPCYVTFESDPPEEPDEDYLEEERAMAERDEPDDDWPEDEGKAYGDRPR